MPTVRHGPASAKATRRLVRALVGEAPFEMYVARKLTHEVDLEAAHWFSGLPAGSTVRLLLGAQVLDDDEIDLVGVDDPEDTAREIAATAQFVGRPGIYSALAHWVPGVDRKLYGVVLLVARLDPF
jgi:hypothetical protein